MKPVFSLILVYFILFLNSVCIEAISVSAECACVIDAATGRVIYNKNMEKQHTMASTTKIMTALVALESSNLDDIVTVSKNAAGEEGTSLYLKAGQKATMEDLLYGLMLQSGNDAAVAIAEGVSGTVSDFAALMNKKAQDIGAVNSSFKNPNGLDEEGHFTTAYDLAIITREAMKNEKFCEIVATKSKLILDGTQTVSNHNKMLRMYDGCTGVKTGFTKKSGRCLVTSAERGGVKVIAVTLNAPSDWNDHRTMLDYAFDTTACYTVIAAGMTVNTVPVVNGTSNNLELTAQEDFTITDNKNEKFKNVTVKCNIPSQVTAPITEGEVIGDLTVYYCDKPQKTIKLIASASVGYEEKGSKIFENFKKLLTYGCEFQNFIVK